MAKQKQILQGIDNFKEIIDKNGYYVDKTLLIKDLSERPDKVVLITRPRRFGKTLNLSMLKYFFEIPECRQHTLEDIDVSYLFTDLKIFAEEKYHQLQGTYPVVYLTFKEVKQNTWEKAYQNLKETIAGEYRRHRYIIESNVLSEVEKKIYNKVMNYEGNEVDYTNVIKNLTDYLKRYFKKKCMVIIDEYDTPIQAGYLNGYFRQIIEFKRSMLVKGFKDNEALKQGVLTGIMKVAQESIFSDFNNPLVETLLSERFHEYFGFVELEVTEMAAYYGLEGDLEGIKNWYNGYIFGLDTVIYNPWSILKFISSPREGFKPHWINTSDNQILKEVLQLDKKEGKEVVEKLIQGEEVYKVIEENVVYQSIKDNPEVAWSFLLHAGYLKASGRRKDLLGEKFEYQLEIPNVEVRLIYRDMIRSFFKEEARVAVEIENLIQSLVEKDLETFTILLEELYFKQVSYYDLPPQPVAYEKLGLAQQKIRHENFYHGFMLGLLSFALDKYQVYSNKEYGLGRPDLALIPRDKKQNPTAYLFEFKWDSTKGKKSLEELAQAALQQIEEKKYREGLIAAEGLTEVVALGVGFKGKELLVQRT